MHFSISASSFNSTFRFVLKYFLLGEKHTCSNQNWAIVLTKTEGESVLLLELKFLEKCVLWLHTLIVNSKNSYFYNIYWNSLIPQWNTIFWMEGFLVWGIFFWYGKVVFAMWKFFWRYEEIYDFLFYFLMFFDDYVVKFFVFNW